MRLLTLLFLLLFSNSVNSQQIFTNYNNYYLSTPKCQVAEDIDVKDTVYFTGPLKNMGVTTINGEARIIEKEVDGIYTPITPSFTYAKELIDKNKILIRDSLGNQWLLTKDSALIELKNKTTYANNNEGCYGIVTKKSIGKYKYNNIHNPRTPMYETYECDVLIAEIHI